MIDLRHIVYFIALAFLTTPAAAELPTAAQLATKLAEVQAATNLDETLKTNLLEHYRRAQSHLEDVNHFNKKAADFTAALKTAPPETARLLKQLKTAPPTPADVNLEQLATTEITQRLSKVIAEVTLADTQMTELEQRLNANIERPAAVRTRLIELNQKLESQTAPVPTSDQAADVALAQRWISATQREAWGAEKRMLEQELLSLAVREALTRAQRDQVAQTLQSLQLRQRALEEQHNQRRSAEVAVAQRASEQAQRRAEDQHPLVQTVTAENAQIVTSGAQLAQQLNGLTSELAALESERKRIEADFRSSKQRLEAAGLSKALGQILLDHRQQLPDLRQLRKTIDQRDNAVAEATLRQIRYREEERQLRDLDGYLTQRLAREVDTAVTPPSAVVRKQLTTALAQRQPLLAQALKVEDDFIRQLSELNYAAEQVVQVATAYDAFLAERLLWVRSASALNWHTLTAVPAALAWLISSEGWWSVVTTLWAQLQINPLFWLGLIITVGLFWQQAALFRAMRRCAEPVRQAHTDRVSLTVQALGLTLLAALPGSLLLWVLGQQLLTPEATGFARAVGMALTETALGLYYLRAFRLICSSGGVAERHFRWRNETLKRLRRDVDGFTLYIIPVALLTVMVFHDNDAERTASLGRLLLVASMIGFAVLFARLLHPRRGVLTPVLAAAPHGWLNRLRHLWFPASIALPLLLAMLALVGYGYTAKILFQSLVYQMWLVLALLVMQQLVVRWLMVTRRRLAVAAALERRAARRAAAEDEETVDLAEPDLAALDEQTRHLINAAIFFSAVGGIWLTWSEVLPALTLLKQFALWHYNGIVDGQAQLTAVTVADVGLVAVILLIAIIAAKNLPALLEIVLLQSHSVSAGERYAIKTLVRYAIVALAFIFAFSAMGFSWSQVQWLAAALSVGIGFGLQEIVANFISGLIILFERPVRVGDIVTIGDTSGVVTNIQIRATTIRNWDRQELLVPNKEFLTERLLNWTLTDQQNRISIPIGLEYGSDTRLALQLLKEIAAAHERVLTEPEPIVSFDSFADSALMLILRCYLDTIEGRIDVVTELHQAIYDRFSEHGLMMAFPQREVHLSTRQPLAVRLQQE